VQLHPPSRDELRRNLRLLADDWTRAGAAMRYYVVAHVVAVVLMLLCSGASVTALLFGERAIQLGFLAAAAAAALQAALCWRVLVRRFRIRYQII